jgi:hypothetical protein
MTTVLGDPDETFAVDWDWGHRLTVWTLVGRRFESRYGDKVLEHELPDSPRDEEAARAAARRWWQDRGRTEALAAGRESGVTAIQPDNGTGRSRH